MTVRSHLRPFFLLFILLLSSAFSKIELNYSGEKSSAAVIQEHGVKLYNLLDIKKYITAEINKDVLNDLLIISAKDGVLKINYKTGMVYGAAHKKVAVAVKTSGIFLGRDFYTLLNKIIPEFIDIGANSIFITNSKPNIYSVNIKETKNGAAISVLFSEALKYKIRQDGQKLAIDFDNGILSRQISNTDTSLVNMEQMQSPQFSRITFMPKFIGKLKGVDRYPGKMIINYLLNKKIRQPDKREKTVTIVIDPGHGGKDPGAIGYKGLKEKDVVLDIGRRLRKMLKRELNVNVIMTRDADYFVTLDDRTKIANRANADLFIAIHCNAAPYYKVNTAKGIEVYFVSEARDRSSKEVEARENAMPGKQGYIEKKHSDDLQMILLSQAYRAHLTKSSALAKDISSSLTSDVSMENRGVRQAMFYVLRGANMPSVLIELGFVTNPSDAQKLTDEKYKQRLTEDIFDGIKLYLEQFER